MTDDYYGRTPTKPRAFDVGDLKIVGVLALVVALVLGGSALLGLAAGVAVRIFLAVSGLR
jgi:hypothetical protein